MLKLSKFCFLVILLAFSGFPSNLWGQDKNYVYENLVELCNLDSLKNNLFEFEKIGVKEINTPALKNTANWLITKYKLWSYSNIQYDSFYYMGDSLINLIITKNGTLYPDSFLIICGHYDTKNGSGAGDNGSGSAIILEIARILKNIEIPISIQFIHFTGEEDGLIGSRHYVNHVVDKNKPDIKLIFNIDAVGGVTTKANDKIVCESDQDNKPSKNNQKSLYYTQLLAKCMKKYAQLEPVSGKTYGSDYMPFQDKAYVITGLYEFNQSPYAHTPDDTYENIDIQYIYRVAKGALGASLHFSESKMK